MCERVNDSLKLIKSVFLCAHLLLILSTVFSFTIEYKYSFRDVSFLKSEKSILWHSFGFFGWQVIHYLIGFLMFIQDNKCNCLAMRLQIFIFEIFQGVIVIVYNYNEWVTNRSIFSRSVSSLLEMTMSSLKYSVYGHVIVTLSVVYLLSLSMYHGMIDNESKDDNDQFRKKVDNYRKKASAVTILMLILLIFFYSLDMYFMKSDSRISSIFMGRYIAFFFVYQVLSLISFLIPETMQELHGNCVLRAFIEQFLVVIYIFNPFIRRLETEFASTLDTYKFFVYFEMIAIPMTLVLRMVYCDLNCKMRIVSNDGKYVDRMIYHQNTMKIRGRTFKEWINIILLIQIFSIIIVPVVWFFEVFIHEYDSIHQLLHFNMQKESFLAVSQSGVMIWIQIVHTFVLYFIVNSVFDITLVWAIELISLGIFLMYWFNPFFLVHPKMSNYLFKNSPYTAISQIISTIIFLFVMVSVFGIGEINENEIDNYDVLDGNEESSTKKENYNHPIYWIKRKKKVESEEEKKNK